MSWNTPEQRVVFAGPPGWSRLPNVTRALLALTAAGYLAGLVVPSQMRQLAVFPDKVWPALELWRLVTYPLAVIGIFNVLFGLLILWMFGWELETVFGSRRFGLFVLSSVVASAVLGCSVALLFPRAGSVAGAGLSGLLTAMIVIWALLGPGLPANLFGILPMTRKG
ncbi:MAG TPA: rhomboid family intramembrane serine protease, partial [Thermoanaerobaculia bacterium]|nr:rhomboid family intramembrane serine protease [Thermoanaerobaculia bacterium]